MKMWMRSVYKILFLMNVAVFSWAMYELVTEGFHSLLIAALVVSGLTMLNIRRELSQ